MEDNDEALCRQQEALTTSPHMDHFTKAEANDLNGGIDWKRTPFFKVVGINILMAEDGVQISQHSDRVGVAVFSSEKDLNNVLAQSPWSSENDSILLEAARPNTVPRDYTFDHLDIRLQFHNIPTEYSRHPLAEDWLILWDPSWSINTMMVPVYSPTTPEFVPTLTSTDRSKQ